jgi:hypothetical protein
MTLITRISRFISRHRVVVRDLALIAAFVALGMTLAYRVDIFPNDGDGGPRPRTIELDEALLVGGLTLTAGILRVFGRIWNQPSPCGARGNRECSRPRPAGGGVDLKCVVAAGVRITLDNFGTGYSTLYHLRACKLDKIKIDAAFVTAMSSERSRRGW